MWRIGIVASLVVVAGCVGSREAPGPTEHEHHVVEMDAAALTRVRLSMRGGELEVKGGSSKLLEGDFTYNVPAWKPSIILTPAGTDSELEISQGAEPAMLSRTENHWQIAFNDARPMDLTAQLIAGEARLHLGTLNLRHVELHMGAGEAQMDLRGTPAHSYSAEIHGGVGSATVYVPTTVGISATASGGIGDISVTGLEKRDGRWINPRAPSSPVTIDLDVHGGIGEIRIVAE